MKEIKREVEETDEDYRKFARDLTLLGSLFLIILSNIIPIFGPGFIAFTIGYRKRRYRHYGLNNVNSLMAMMIGEIICFVIVFAFVRYDVDLPKLWIPVILGFMVNAVALIGAYFIGIKKSKK
jgi:hypothetical protein